MTDNRLPSAHQVGDPVIVKLNGQELPGYIRAVIFTSSKVRYGVRFLDLEEEYTTFHNIDSYFVHEDPTRESVNWGLDNYS